MYLFDHTGEGATAAVAEAYSVPKYFTPENDLFEVLDEDDRPPYRWMLVGAPKSGSAIHT